MWVCTGIKQHPSNRQTKLKIEVERIKRKEDFEFNLIQWTGQRIIE